MNGKRWLIGLSALVVLSSLLGGCRQGPTAEEIVNRMQEVEASTEDAHAVVEFSGQVEGLDVKAVVELWEKKPGKLRAEVLEASEAGLEGIVSVTDGQQVWLYHPGENEVLTGSVGELEIQETGSRINPQQLLALTEEWIQWILDHFDVELAGEENLGGVATYKLELTPKQGEEASLPIPIEGTATLWVEQERWIVLQAHADGGSLGEGWLRVRSFDLNAGVADDRFQFEIPAGAEVVQIEDTRPVPLTLDEARAQAEFPLLVPAYVPEGVTLTEVSAVGSTFVLRYGHAATSFTIVQRLEEAEAPGQPTYPAGPIPRDSAVEQEVTVRGQAAILVTGDAGDSLLSWTEEGVSITIAGHVDQIQVLQVAESLQ